LIVTYSHAIEGTPTQSVHGLDGLYRTLTQLELAFFRVLDEELNKVEEFYLEREKELVLFASLLNEQLHELEVHRKIYHVCKLSKFLPSLI
jgi:hypothetical protein